jgi:hypothetical protein
MLWSDISKCKNYVPIDYIKTELIEFNCINLVQESSLNFGELINSDTGEFVKRFSSNGIEKKPCRTASHKNLIFRFYPDTGRLFMSGSLHTYWNNGEHNANLFDIGAFNEVLNELNSLFGIKPHHLKITQIEWGVNISPPIKSNAIIDACLFQKWVRFEVKYDNSEGKYHQAEHKKYYIIKIYNKGLQFGLGKEMLRFERKQLDYLKYTKQKGIGQTLADLINSDFIGMKETLLFNLNEVLFFSPLIKDENDKMMRYRDPLFWVDLRHEVSSTMVHKHIKKLRCLNSSKGGDIQGQLSELINEAIASANSKKLQDSSFSYNKNTATTDIESIKLCQLTNIDISMQRAESLYLSHAGLWSLLQNDVNLFDEVRRKHLSSKWIGSDITTQIREIAHNIRTKYNDKIKKERKKYLQAVGQYDMFTNRANNILAVHYGV